MQEPVKYGFELRNTKKKGEDLLKRSTIHISHQNQQFDLKEVYK